MIKPYFPYREGDPKPLSVTVKRKIRFEEVDPLGIVWHGRYPSYFEDARVALGEKFRIGYMDFYKNNVIAPIRIMHIDYHRPLRFQDEISIEGIMHWSDASRINSEFVIKDGKGRLATTGYTVQVMLDPKDNLYLIPPPFFNEFREQWKKGLFNE